MIRFRTLLPVLLVLCATTLAGCASSRSALPDEWDGLVLQPGTRLGAVFVKPDAEIVAYTERDARPGGGQFRQELGSEPRRPQPARPAQCRAT